MVWSTVMAVKAVPFAALAIIFLGACTSSNPAGLARVDEPTTSKLPPVTTAPLPTTTTQPEVSTSDVPQSEDSDDPTQTTEPVAPAGIDAIINQLGPLLGSTSDLTGVVGEIAPPIALIGTPLGSTVVELSVATGTVRPDGTTLAQIGVTVTTPEDPVSAFDRVAAPLRGAGLIATDAVSTDTLRSGSYRLPNDALFDEVVVTANQTAIGASVRVISSATMSSEQLNRYTNWAIEPLPLPPEVETRTLVVLRRSGEGALETTTLTVESTGIVEGTSLQQQANTLVFRIDGSEFFSPLLEVEGDQPLNGEVAYEPLDELNYSVSPSTTDTVDGEGEIEVIDVILVRLTGRKQIEAARIESIDTTQIGDDPEAAAD